jgi:hypothetical protein
LHGLSGNSCRMHDMTASEAKVKVKTYARHTCGERPRPCNLTPAPPGRAEHLAKVEVSQSQTRCVLDQGASQRGKRLAIHTVRRRLVRQKSARREGRAASKNHSERKEGDCWYTNRGFSVATVFSATSLAQPSISYTPSWPIRFLGGCLVITIWRPHAKCAAR